MNIKLIIPCLLLMVGCGSQPDSSGKVYEIDINKAKKELHQQLDRLIEDDDEHHEAYYRRSKLFYEEGTFSEALKDISKALKFKPTSQLYLAQQAKTFSVLNQYEKAYRVFSKIDEENMTSELQKFKLIAGVKTGKVADTAIETAMEGLKLEQGRKEYLLGMLAWDRNDTTQAQQKLEVAYKNGERGEDVLLTLVKTYDIETEKDKILNRLDEAAERFKSKHARILLANYCVRYQMHEKEDSVYEVMLVENAKDSEVIMRRAKLYEAQGRNSEIIALLETRFEKTKTVEDDMVLANAYFQLRKNKESMEIYSRLEPLDTTGQVKRNISILNWRKQQERLKNLPDSMRTITKDSVNSTP